jgi:hypothetical protein
MVLCLQRRDTVNKLIQTIRKDLGDLDDFIFQDDEIFVSQR